MAKKKITAKKVAKPAEETAPEEKAVGHINLTIKMPIIKTAVVMRQSELVENLLNASVAMFIKGVAGFLTKFGVRFGEVDVNIRVKPGTPDEIFSTDEVRSE